MSRSLAILLALAVASVAHADPRPETYWNVDAVRPGMKGIGRTVIKGTKIESFDAAVATVTKLLELADSG